MKKIMFSEKHGMMDAVLRGRKTMTRRLCDAKKKYDKYKIWQPAEQMPYGLYGFNEDEGWAYINPRYFIGEIVAIAFCILPKASITKHKISNLNKCIIEAKQFISALNRHFWQYAVMCRFLHKY